MQLTIPQDSGGMVFLCSQPPERLYNLTAKMKAAKIRKESLRETLRLCALAVKPIFLIFIPRG
jgi:hypothetical protein